MRPDHFCNHDPVPICGLSLLPRKGEVQGGCGQAHGRAELLGAAHATAALRVPAESLCRRHLALQGHDLPGPETIRW